jgi:hypothetical protein
MDLQLTEWIVWLGKIIVPLGVLATGVSAIVAVRKYSSDRRAQDRNNALQNRNSALQSYGGYLKLAFENPEFARPDDDWDEISKSPARFRKYRWFVSIMLLAFEEIINFDPTDPEWELAILWQLRYHTRYTRTEYFKAQMEMHDPRLQAMINKVNAEIGS